MRLYRRPLKNTSLCKFLQRKLLLNEIRFKRKLLTLKHTKLEETRAALKECVRGLNYSCILLWLQRRQNTTNKQTRRIHKQKLHKWGIASETNILEPDKVIPNFSNSSIGRTKANSLFRFRFWHTGVQVMVL